jgi:hypothetical protein
MTALRMTSAALTTLTGGIGTKFLDPAILNPSPGEASHSGGLRLVGTQPPADRQLGIVPGNSAAIGALINTGAQSIAVPATFGPAWLQIPPQWVNALFAGTGVTPPTDGPLQLSTECALDARGIWATALVQSGLFAAFANPTALPLPVLSS